MTKIVCLQSSCIFLINRVKDYLNFYVQLSVLPDQKIPISIDANDDISTLEQQIAERIQVKLDFLKDIDNLIVRCSKTLPNEGKIGDCIEEGETLSCQFECREIWIRVLIVISDDDHHSKPKSKNSQNKIFSAEMSVKISLKNYVIEFK